jgi:hypothetical protein
MMRRKRNKKRKRKRRKRIAELFENCHYRYTVYTIKCLVQMFSNVIHENVICSNEHKKKN